MKKIYVAIAGILISAGAYSQAQRVQLYEEFTGENCPPCASTNPRLNQILDANESKIIAIKYQSPIPSAGPLHNQNKPDVNTRISYYAINSAPSGKQDGANYATSQQSHPGYFVQGDIDQRVSVVSPFELTVTHRLSPNADSIYVDVTAKAVGAVSGTLKCRIAVVENEIVFENAPGTNGEKKFEDVMKKMLPNAAGTTMPASMAVGEEFTVSQSWKLANVYDLNELAVVAFIQNDADKKVHQAAYSEPVPLALDLGLKNAVVPLYQCDAKLTPSITLYNAGAGTITSATISYTVDGGTAQTFNWNGSLASKATTLIQAPELTLPTGSHTALFNITQINGETDINGGNNSLKATVNIYTSAAPGNTFVENFQSANFPANNFFINNVDGDGETWIKGTGASGFASGASQSSAKVLTYYGPAGNKDELYLPNLDLTPLSGQAYINYDIAHCGVAAGPVTDKLQVLLSSDCGTTWSVVDTKENSELITSTAFTNSFFTPTATQWKRFSADLSSFTNLSDVIIKFVATAGSNGNFLWLDNINVQRNATTGIETSSLITGVSIFPNPATDNSNVQLNLAEASDVTIEIFNMLGAKVGSYNYTSQSNGAHTYNVDLSGLSTGIYSVQVLAGESTFKQNISVTR
jgi:hypothetical protein